MRIDPAPRQWARRVGSSPGFGSTEARRFREQLGLPLDRPVIMTGHQPVFWHPGILAKFLACDAASALGAPAWIVPDQDEIDPASVRIPISDDTGTLRSRRIALAPPPPLGTPAASLPPIDASQLEFTDAPLDSISDGVREIQRTMRAHKSEASLARQAQGALVDLLAPFVARSPTVFATQLCSTELFHSLVEQMEADPESMSRAYSGAVAAHPGAGVQKLIASEVHDRWELPLWRLRPGEPRRRVYAEQVSEIPPDELAPRALFMTALLRMAGCDLFIHGTGGEAYDQVTETWIDAWLKRPLAHTAVVTATLLLPLRESVPSDEDVSRAIWKTHSAMHNPGAIGRADIAQQKKELLERIDASQRKGDDPSPIFRQMHALLDAFRSDNQDALQAVQTQAQMLVRAASEREIAQDRTWAFPLHATESVLQLKSQIRDAFVDVGPAIR